jgi:hypothetical protein
VHENAKRGDSRLPATGENRHRYAKSAQGAPSRPRMVRRGRRFESVRGLCVSKPFPPTRGLVLRGAAVLPGSLVIGLGAGFAFPTIYGAATVDVEQHQTATASAVIQMARQIGAVLGVAPSSSSSRRPLFRGAASTASLTHGGWRACSRQSPPSPPLASAIARVSQHRGERRRGRELAVGIRSR